MGGRGRLGGSWGALGGQGDSRLQCCSHAQCGGWSWLLGETKAWEVEKRGIFQSRQGQRACADCWEGLDKERRKMLALQEEKLELQKVSACPGFQWGQDHTGGSLGWSTSHPLSEAKPVIQACMSHGECLVLPNSSRAKFICRKVFLRGWSF